jgi:hypothetical protein
MKAPQGFWFTVILCGTIAASAAELNQPKLTGIVRLPKKTVALLELNDPLASG